jgi:hypothetical protein
MDSRTRGAARSRGGLVPLDTVWRFGANMATTLHTDVDITLGELKLPRGDYTLFILYARHGLHIDRESRHGAVGGY